MVSRLGVVRLLLSAAGPKAEQVLDAGFQSQIVEGLRRLIVGPHVEPMSLSISSVLAVSKIMGTWENSPDFGAGGQAIHFRHHTSQHHQVRLSVPGQVHGFQTVGAGDDLVALVFQIESDAP